MAHFQFSRLFLQNWTETYVRWSPKGTYLATLHHQGIALWGGEEFKRLMRFSHPGVQLIDFSPCERCMLFAYWLIIIIIIIFIIIILVKHCWILYEPSLFVSFVALLFQKFHFRCTCMLDCSLKLSMILLVVGKLFPVTVMLHEWVPSYLQLSNFLMIR